MIINLINNITWNILSKFIGKFLVRNHLMEESGFPGIASAPNMSTWTLMAGRSRVSLWQVRICHWRIRPGGQSPSSQWQIGDIGISHPRRSDPWLPYGRWPHGHPSASLTWTQKLTCPLVRLSGRSSCGRQAVPSGHLTMFLGGSL